MQDLSTINIVVDKKEKSEGYDVLEQAWKPLIQRFSNTISYRKFPGPANPDDKGLIVPDMSEVKKLFRIMAPLLVLVGGIVIVQVLVAAKPEPERRAPSSKLIRPFASAISRWSRAFMRAGFSPQLSMYTLSFVK